MAFTREQRNVIRRSLRVAQRLNASPRERKALVEALGVESGYRDLPYGDRDSVGALQQRPGKGWGPAGEPLETDVSQFLRAAAKVNRGGFHGSAGSLAQAVQRSAFPGRYDQRSSEADSLLGQFLGSDSGGGGGLQPQTQGPPALPGLTLTPGASTAGLIQSLLNKPEPAPVGALRPSATAAHAALPAGYQGIQSSGGPRSERDLSGLLGALSAQNPGLPSIGSPSTSGDAQNGFTAPQQRVASDLVSSIKDEADLINSAQVPYQWGGGHGGKQARGSKVTPLDCSGAVSRVLGIDPRVSGQFEKWGKPGRGRITVYANRSHVLMEIDGHFFGTSSSNPGGGAGWIPRKQISGDYLKNFTARHL